MEKLDAKNIKAEIEGAWDNTDPTLDHSRMVLCHNGYCETSLYFGKTILGPSHEIQFLIEKNYFSKVCIFTLRPELELWSF